MLLLISCTWGIARAPELALVFVAAMACMGEGVDLLVETLLRRTCLLRQPPLLGVLLRPQRLVAGAVAAAAAVDLVASRASDEPRLAVVQTRGIVLTVGLLV